VIADRGRTREQPIERHKGGYRREDREQTVEDDTRGDREQPVLADLLVGAPENILPAPPGYLPRHFGVTASTRLVRALVLYQPWSVAAGSAKGACSPAPYHAPLRAVFANHLACEHYPDKYGGAQKRP
jgi:hypothetical protein